MECVLVDRGRGFAGMERLFAEGVNQVNGGYVDVHAHLADARLRERLDVILAECVQQGVGGILVNAARREEWPAVEALSRRPGVFGALGIHPFFPEDWRAETLAELRQALTAPESRGHVLAVGEIGLDFQHGRDLAARQLAMFRAQLQLARELDLPVCLHNRKAWPDFFGLLKELGWDQVRGYCHHFTGSMDIAREALDHGLYLSFCGPVTYPDAHRLHRVARYAPADRILTETDCPDLPAQEYRGQESRPWHVHSVVQCLAALRGEAPEQVASHVWANWQRLFFPDAR